MLRLVAKSGLAGLDVVVAGRILHASLIHAGRGAVCVSLVAVGHAIWGLVRLVETCHAGCGDEVAQEADRARTAGTG